MKQSLVFSIAAALAVLFPCVATVFSQEPAKNSDAFRKAFLEKFPRIGLNTAPGDAMMLRILIASRNAKRGIEVGTASGFGAVNMGMAFERNGGRLYSLEIDPKFIRECRENLQKVGLEKTVTVVEGDALKLLPSLEGQFDFIFIDAMKRDYLKYLKAIEPKLSRGAVVVGDNVIKSARAMGDFLEYVQTSPDYETVIIRASEEKSDGMSVSYKVR